MANETVPPNRDFEEDLRRILGERIRSSDDFASNIWSALANVEWNHPSGAEFSCSFRHAGGLIADIRGETNHMAYMKWYMSGPYSQVSGEIADAMLTEGWTHKNV